MKLDNLKDINRLAIYFFYDADGIVDRYVPYMLEDVKKNCSELFVVCNGKLTQEGRKTLSGIADHLLVRENEGFDVWAYKSVLEQYGWKKLGEYDEIVMMNFTIFGPLYPFSQMFDEMNHRDLDFWGITKYPKYDSDPFGTICYGYIPEHIQSHFIAVRKDLIDSLEFQRYWDKMGAINNYNDAVGKHEAIFTKHFSDMGFGWDTYVDTDDLEGYTEYPLMFMGKELIKNRRCPIFKRKVAGLGYENYLHTSTGETVTEMFAYIRDNLNYDLDMVWENMLRLDNMADIKSVMHLNYILPKNIATHNRDGYKLKTALAMHIYYADEAESCVNYADAMPLDADVFITVCSEKTRKAVMDIKDKLLPRNVKVLEIPNRGRDVGSLLVGVEPYIFDYDLVCFVHDKKSKQVRPYSIGASWSHMLFENLLGSRKYVENIISRFSAEPRLGMVMPPNPYHRHYIRTVSDGWTCNFENTVQLAKKIGLHVNLDYAKEPITPLGTMFWFRPNALLPLYQQKWTYEDFPPEPNDADGTILHAIERIYGFCAQSQGYYLAWCMNEEYASYIMTSYYHMLHGLINIIFARLGVQWSFYETTLALDKVLSSYASQAMIRPSGKPISARLVVKDAIKRRIPKSIWNICVKVYHLFGGKKWLG